MMCIIYKPLISIAADKGQSLPKWINRHVRNCPSCNEYASICNLLENQSSKDASEMLKNTDDSLSYRIIDTLKNLPDESCPVPSLKFHSFYRFIPAMVAATLILVVGIIFFGESSFRQKPGEEMKLSNLRFEELKNPSARLADLFSSVESPMETELQSIVKNIKSAKKYFSDYLSLDRTGN